jgi:hypothetical protein
MNDPEYERAVARSIEGHNAAERRRKAEREKAKRRNREDEDFSRAIELSKKKDTGRSSRNDNLRLVNVDGDGACLFRSVAIGFDHSLEDDRTQQTVNANKLRDLAVKNICDNWGTYRHSIQGTHHGITKEEYRALMSQRHEYGDEPEIRSLSEVVQKRIIVHRRIGDYEPRTYGKQFSASNPIHITHEGEHYQVFIPRSAGKKKSKKREKREKRTRPKKREKRTRPKKRK